MSGLNYIFSGGWKYCGCAVFMPQAHFYSPTLFLLSVGWGERVRWQGETHAYLWSLQCQSEPPSPRQLAGHTLPVPPVSSKGFCDTAFLGSWLCQSTLTLPDMQGDTDTVLQTGWLPERAGENLGSWGEWRGIFSLSRPKPAIIMRLKRGLRNVYLAQWNMDQWHKTYRSLA